MLRDQIGPYLILCSSYQRDRIYAPRKENRIASLSHTFGEEEEVSECLIGV